MYNQNIDEISDFASFKQHYKQALALKNEDESDWRCAENDDGVYLFVFDDEEPDGSVPDMDPSLYLPASRHSIVIDKELNVEIASKDDKVQVHLNEGEPLASYSQLLTIMYVLTETYELEDEEYLEEWLENETQLKTIHTPEPYLGNGMTERGETYTENGKKKFKCSYCPKRFTRPIRQREHENVHTGNKPYVCTVCFHAFSSSSSWFAHNQLHNGVRNHECPDCDRKFHRKRNMVLHYKAMHLKEKPYTCPICQRLYSDRACYKRHIERHSQAECTTPRIKRILPAAKPKATEEKDQQLKRSFKSSKLQTKSSDKEKTNSTVRRKRNTLPKRHSCDLCGVMFARRRNVEYHLKYTHTGIKPYECELCGKKYSDINSFKSHIRAHTVIMPVQQCAAGGENGFPA